MALFTMLLVLLLERSHLLPTNWRLERWWQDTEQRDSDRRILGDWRWELLRPLLPALATAVLLALIDDLLWGSLSLLMWLLVLAACIGQPQLRRYYHDLIRAGCRGDDTAQALHEDELRSTLGASAAPLTSLAQVLFWCNFRYYAAPLLLAALAGPVAVVLYVSLWHVLQQRDDLHPRAQLIYGHLLAAVEHILVRISGLMYVVVGDFSRGFTCWLHSLYEWRQPPAQLLATIATATADSEALRHSPLVSACHSVTLAKRHITGLLVLVALLTIYGWVL